MKKLAILFLSLTMLGGCTWFGQSQEDKQQPNQPEQSTGNISTGDQQTDAQTGDISTGSAMTGATASGAVFNTTGSQPMSGEDKQAEEIIEDLNKLINE